MEFKREEYLNKLTSRIGNHMIKIVTGIRRCGKSYLLDRIFYKHLLENGTKPANIIRFAFDFDDDVDKLDAFFPELPTRVEDDKGHFLVNSKESISINNNSIIVKIPFNRINDVGDKAGDKISLLWVNKLFQKISLTSKMVLFFSSE